MNTQYTEIPMSHWCAASTADDHLTRWDADVAISDNGYMDEMVQCPACGSWVNVLAEDDAD